MDEWEIREDERDAIVAELKKSWGKEGSGAKLAIEVIQKRGHLLRMRIEPITILYSDMPNDNSHKQLCNKINELVEAVNELNMRFGEKYA